MAVTSSHILSSAFLAHLWGETSTQVRVALVWLSTSSTVLGFALFLTMRSQTAVPEITAKL